MSRLPRLIEDVDGVMVPVAHAQKGGRDGCAVPTGDLADLLDRCCDRVRTVAMPGSQTGGGSDDRTSRAAARVEWIAEQTRRRDPSGRGVHTRTIERILSERGRDGVTPLRTADLLATALGAAPDVFHNGTLPYVENGRASRGAREIARYVTASALGGGLDTQTQIGV